MFSERHFFMFLVAFMVDHGEMRYLQMLNKSKLD
ncbi:hypothetical protein DFP76_106190 [Marinomonas aquiplantarum]|uniref:Uncharacterized protein n=1 Tax=Marinomonas aquiplantarum TaxID=491951 RepID=A0A366CWZ7_9GAMM|nr:hypothetical protein DFP76_106190 [Marinomonas aquiplantarum]